jgi:hypothetical protein
MIAEQCQGCDNDYGAHQFRKAKFRDRFSPVRRHMHLEKCNNSDVHSERQ